MHRNGNIKKQPLTRSIANKGFRDFRKVSPASSLDGNLIGLKPAIPYEIIHLPLVIIAKRLHNYEL
jgi:hypothetical protein